MKQWKRLFVYLLLNVLVSACTTFAVLLIWDRTQEPIPGGLIRTVGIQLPGQAAADASPTPAGPAEPTVTPTPAYTAYQVEEGDTFESIAQEFGVSVEELMAHNGFQNEILGVGEVLQIPIPPTPQPVGDVLIDRVVGAGDLNTERVLLRHSGEGEVTLVGWQLEDENGNVFTFPEFPSLTLFKDGAVNVYTREGTDSVVDVYWRLQQPVWQPGETVTLRDPSGKVRGEYQVP